MDLILLAMYSANTPTENVRKIYRSLSDYKEKEDQAEIKEERSGINKDLKLRNFYETFQQTINQIFLAHQVLQTGLVERHQERSWIESGLKIAGENVPFPGAKLVGDILSRAVGVYRRRRAERETGIHAGRHVSPTAMSEAVEELARELTFTYQEPLQKLEDVTPFAKGLVRRILTYWSGYTGITGLDEMGNIKLYLSMDEGRIQSFVSSIKEQLPAFVQEYLLKEMMVRTREGISLSDQAFLRGISICNTYPSATALEKYHRMKDPATPHVSYGYRLGTREEAERLEFYAFDGTTYTSLSGIGLGAGVGAGTGAGAGTTLPTPNATLFSQGKEVAISTTLAVVANETVQKLAKDEVKKAQNKCCAIL